MANAALFDILEAIRADILALSLLGLADANIVVQKAAATRAKELPVERLPCVVIAPFGAESIAPGSNVRDDVTYPVLVAICASEKDESEQPQSEQKRRFNQYLVWRESIRKSFSNQRLTASLCHLVTVAPLAIADREAWFDKGLWVSGMVLRLTNRESKG